MKQNSWLLEQTDQLVEPNSWRGESVESAGGSNLPGLGVRGQSGHQMFSMLTHLHSTQFSSGTTHRGEPVADGWLGGTQLQTYDQKDEYPMFSMIDDICPLVDHFSTVCPSVFNGTFSLHSHQFG